MEAPPKSNDERDILRLAADLDNLRGALTWSLVHREAEVTGRLAAALMPFWISRGHVSEGCDGWRRP